jgi:hypothetical protein
MFCMNVATTDISEKGIMLWCELDVCSNLHVCFHFHSVEETENGILNFRRTAATLTSHGIVPTATWFTVALTHGECNSAKTVPAH